LSRGRRRGGAPAGAPTATVARAAQDGRRCRLEEGGCRRCCSTWILLVGGLIGTVAKDSRDPSHGHPRHDQERGDACRVQGYRVAGPAVRDEQEAAVMPQPGQLRPVSPLNGQSGTGDSHPGGSSIAATRTPAGGDQDESARTGSGSSPPAASATKPIPRRRGARLPHRSPRRSGRWSVRNEDVPIARPMTSTIPSSRRR